MPEHKILVAEKEIYGRYCGQYRIYDKDNPNKTIGYTQSIHLSDFLDSCVLAPPYGIHWEGCMVKNPSEEAYTVLFDKEFKRELAKELLSKLIALNNETDIYCGEDVVNECQTICNENPMDEHIVSIIGEYLGLSCNYAWIFK